MYRLTRFLFLAFITITYAEPSEGNEEKSFAISLASMVPLLDVEKQLIEILENYVKKLEDKVVFLKALGDEMVEENLESLKDPEGYVSNPLNSFRLIRRLQRDWINIEAYIITHKEENEYVEAMAAHHKQMPTSIDLQDAVEGIDRLQTVYDLEIDAMANGILNGKQYKYRLSSLDRYTMGVHLFDQKRYQDALFWLYSSILSYQNNSFNTVLDFHKTKIFELYAESLLELNRPKDALTAISRAAELNIFDTRLLKRKNDIEMLAKTHKLVPQEQRGGEPTDFQLGCRGNFSTIPSKLYCIYNTTTTAFLRLAPFKMEFLSLDPYIALYHDVLTDREIVTLKDLVKTNLKRATVFDKYQQKNTINHERTAKISWLPDDSSNTTLGIIQKLADMTGLNTSGWEPMQIMNYGLGGHFKEHFDFFNFSEMSDVEQGGSTIFPNIRTVVSPRKGTALVWYNLDNALNADSRTLHAACPVLAGSKWGA
uniref:procollagen-proline 4-dioxygenase n=1 Tax=Glossina pallidipes TaxID=7398 RepID=A0A1A9ZZK9_GLOPL